MLLYSKIFFSFGIFFTSMAVFLFVIHYISSTFPSAVAIWSVALATMSFCLAYLYPKLSLHPEQMQRIKFKSLIFTIVFVILLSMFGWLLIETEVLLMTPSQFIQIMIAMLVISFFTFMVVLTKLI